MIIRKTSDIIRLKIGELTVKVSPLSRIQKAEVQALISRGTIEDALAGTSLALKYAVKDVEGLQLEDGSKYELAKDEAGNLDDETLDDLMNAEFGEKITYVALNLLSNVPSEFTNPNTGEKLKGVKVIKETSGKK